MTIGDISGTSLTHSSLDTVTAIFDIPTNEVEDLKNAVVTFTTPQGQISFTMVNGFTVGDPVIGGGLTNGAPSPGYNLFGTIISTNTYLMDNDGNIVKTWSSKYSPGNSVYLLENSTLMRTAKTGSTNFNSGGAGGRVEQYDWDGNLIWAFDYDTTEHRLHHDIEVMTNGNILMIAWELKTKAEALAVGRSASLLTDGKLWPDHVIEVAPTGSYGGTIVWEWHIWDHLVETNVNLHPELIDINYVMSGPAGRGADWNHINAIDYNEELDQILLSARNQSEIWIIDHNTTTAEAAGSAGDLLYRWGNPQVYLGGGFAQQQQLFGQHDVRWIPDGRPGAGNLTVFNNGRDRFDGAYSSVDEIRLPKHGRGGYGAKDATMPAKAEIVWSFSGSGDKRFYSSHISGAERLPNGNTLICAGIQGRIFEVTPHGKIVWDYFNPITEDMSADIPPWVTSSNPMVARQIEPFGLLRASRVGRNHPGLKKLSK